MTTSQSLDVHTFRSISLLNGNLSGQMTQGRREMVAGRWRDILGREDDGVQVDPGRPHHTQEMSSFCQKLETLTLHEIIRALAASRVMPVSYYSSNPPFSSSFKGPCFTKTEIL